ncbi:DNA-3-methyladenine glycosylase [soil metagenome]
MNNPQEFLELKCSAPEAAQRLLGCELERTLSDGSTVRVKITETEAYDELDPASHTFRGITPRNSVMYGPAGYLYVYFIYGMHYCCNIVTGPKGRGEAVLIRAVEPITGDATTNLPSGNTLFDVSSLNGPAKVCAAMDITRDLNGHNLNAAPLRLLMRPPIPNTLITATERIGISKGVDTCWRFYLTDSTYVSKRMATNKPRIV